MFSGNMCSALIVGFGQLFLMWWFLMNEYSLLWLIIPSIYNTVVVLRLWRCMLGNSTTNIHYKLFFHFVNKTFCDGHFSVFSYSFHFRPKELNRTWLKSKTNKYLLRLSLTFYNYDIVSITQKWLDLNGQGSDGMIYLLSISMTSHLMATECCHFPKYLVIEKGVV